jgi:hypothetical protein
MRVLHIYILSPTALLCDLGLAHKRGLIKAFTCAVKST